MSDLTLVIGNKNYSSWSLRPWIFLRYNSIEFKEKRIPLFVESTEHALKEYNSDYKVPILKDGELVIWDSLSILEYLSEVYLNGTGWPKSRNSRAIARSICAEMHSSFFNIRSEMPMNCRKKFSTITLSQEATHEVDRIIFLWQKCRNEYAIDGKWLFGSFSIADAMFAPIVLRFSGYNIPIEGPAANYMEHMLQLPELIEWIDAGKEETEIIEMCEISD